MSKRMELGWKTCPKCCDFQHWNSFPKGAKYCTQCAMRKAQNDPQSETSRLNKLASGAWS